MKPITLTCEGLSVRLPAALRIQVGRIAQNLGITVQQLLDLEMAKNVAQRPELQRESRDVFERGGPMPEDPMHVMALWAFHAFHVKEARDILTGEWRHQDGYVELPADVVHQIQEAFPGQNVNDVAREALEAHLDALEREV